MVTRIIFLLIAYFFCYTMAQAQKNAEPIPVIFDTDMGPDYDDVGAMAVLHAYADSG